MNISIFFKNPEGALSLASLVINAIPTVINAILSAVFGYWLWSKKKDVESSYAREFEKYKKELEVSHTQEVEKHKKQLEVAYMKVEIKTKQLSIIYPELFVNFKIAESSITGLCTLVQKSIGYNNTDMAKVQTQINIAVGYMVRNLLFISKDVENYSDSLMVVMNEFESALKRDTTGILSYKQKLCSTTDQLQNQMKKELGCDVF